MARAAACALARSGALAVIRPSPSEASVNARNTRISSWKVSRPSLTKKKENKRGEKKRGEKKKKGGEEGAKGDASERQCARQRLFRDAKDVTHNMRFERQLL